MSFVCDILICFAAFVYLVIRAELIPIDGVNTFFLPFTKYILLGMVLILLLKYIVYIVRTLQDIRVEAIDKGRSNPQRYSLLAVYPVCDLARLFISVGFISAMVNQQMQGFSLINPFADHMVLVVLVLVALVIGYFCYDAYTIRFNLIATAVFVLPVLVFSKDLFWQGLRLFL